MAQPCCTPTLRTRRCEVRIAVKLAVSRPPCCWPIKPRMTRRALTAFTPSMISHRSTKRPVI
eukprot:3095843-Pyramimonas_sp.AAC.1